MHFLATSYKRYTLEANEKAAESRVATCSKSCAKETPGRSATSTDSGKRKAREVTPKIVLNTTPGDNVTRTSSGRVVRQRIQIVSDDSCDDEEDDVELQQENNKETSATKTKPKPTSLNPFQIPVHLLNFRPSQNKKS